MPMTSSEITIDHFQGWTPIVCTGTVVHIAEITGGEILLKFGANSNVHGVTMAPGDTIMANETIYVRAVADSNSYPTIHVIKD